MLAFHPQVLPPGSKTAPVALGILWPHMTTSKQEAGRTSNKKAYLSVSEADFLDFICLILFLSVCSVNVESPSFCLRILLDDFRYVHALKR